MMQWLRGGGEALDDRDPLGAFRPLQS